MSHVLDPVEPTEHPLALVIYFFREEGLFDPQGLPFLLLHPQRLPPGFPGERPWVFWSRRTPLLRLSYVPPLGPRVRYRVDYLLIPPDSLSLFFTLRARRHRARPRP